MKASTICSHLFIIVYVISGLASSISHYDETFGDALGYFTYAYSNYLGFRG